MSIPKVIYQTFKNDQLPFLTRWHIKRMRLRNPKYDYQFFDDKRVDEFILKEFGKEVFELYRTINIGAAKADFFRYAVLYKYGGVYLDIDSLNVKALDSFIQSEDRAIISLEGNQEYFVQWALIFEAGHPFLEKTLEMVVHNLRQNAYPNDVHSMTGPAVFSKAIRACLASDPSISYRQMGTDYEGKFKFHYRFSKFFLYGIFRKNHWKKKQQKVKVLR